MRCLEFLLGTHLHEDNSATIVVRLLGPSSRHLSLHFGFPGQQNWPGGFILTSWGAPSGSQKVADFLFLFGMLEFSVVNEALIIQHKM